MLHVQVLISQFTWQYMKDFPVLSILLTHDTDIHIQATAFRINTRTRSTSDNELIKQCNRHCLLAKFSVKNRSMKLIVSGSFFPVRGFRQVK